MDEVEGHRAADRAPFDRLTYLGLVLPSRRLRAAAVEVPVAADWLLAFQTRLLRFHRFPRSGLESTPWPPF